MVMDANDVQSDLLALKRLYGLLKTDGDAPIDSLDKHARSLLKNLLDAATQRVLKEHSEFIPPPKSLITEKEMESDKDSNADGLDISIWKENRQWNQPVGVGNNNRCRLCRKKTINQMKPLEETHFYNGPQDIDCLSKQASQAINHIDSYMSALPSIEAADEMNQKYWLLGQPVMNGGPALGNWIMSGYDFVVQNPNAPVTFFESSKMEGPHFMKTNNSQHLGNQSNSQHKDGTRKKKQYINSRKASLLEVESEGSASTATDSYSEWTSDQTAGSDSEEYSSSGEEDEASSDSWSESEEASSPLSIEDDDNDDDGYSSTNGEESQESISSASFKSKGYSSASKKPGPNRNLKANGKRFKEGSGMWRKMKDKMEIVFHHHHHHHHHGDSDSKTKTRKDKGKAVDFERQEKEAVEKVKKSMIRGKGQKGNLRGMMGGFLKHSKQLKEGIDKKKALKKGLQQHRRMSKLPKKTRVKLGLSKRRADLKTLRI